MKAMLRLPLLLPMLLVLGSAALQTPLASPAAHWSRMLESLAQRHESVWEPSATFPTSNAGAIKTSNEEQRAVVAPHDGEGGGKSTKIDLLLDPSPYLGGYYGEFSIGTPPQKFRMLLSMVYTTVWIPNFRYGAHSRYYNHSQSSTYRANGTMFVMGGLLGGFLSQDVMRIGDFEIAHQDFVEIDAISHDLLPADRFGKSDGVFGLGFDSGRAPSQIKLPFHELVDSGVLQEPLFALYFNRKAGNGTLDIGSIDKSHFKGELVYSDVIRDDMWWIAEFDDIIVQGKNFTKHRRATFFPESPMFLGPRDEVAVLAKAVGAYLKGYQYLIDCASQGPDIEIRIGGVTFPITKEEYTLHREGHGECLWAIQGSFGGIDAWVFGMTFVEKVYTVFNWGDADSKRRMGFALRA